MFECKDWKDEGMLQSYPMPGERAPPSSLTYKFSTIPDGNLTGLLLYFGSVQRTPGKSEVSQRSSDKHVIEAVEFVVFVDTRHQATVSSRWCGS